MQISDIKRENEAVEVWLKYVELWLKYAETSIDAVSANITDKEGK